MKKKGLTIILPVIGAIVALALTLFVVIDFNGNQPPPVQILEKISDTEGSSYRVGATFEESTVSTGSCLPALVVTTNNSGYYSDDYFDPTAYWVKDNIFYPLRVSLKSKRLLTESLRKFN